MTHLISNRHYSNAPGATSRFPAVTVLLLLSVLAACAGDLDPRYVKSGTPTGLTGSGGATSTGAGVATSTGSGSASTGSGGATMPAGGSGGATGAAACDAVGMVFQGKCSAGCHSPNGIWQQLDLSTDAAASMAVGAMQNFMCAADKTSKIVNPTAPLSGTLFLYITGATCGGGTQMPFGGDPLTQTEIDCIKSYFMSKLH